MWKDISTELVGELVTLEPLALDHETELFKAAKPAQIWEFTQIHPTSDRGHSDLTAFRKDFAITLASAITGERVPFATRDNSTKRLIGSTSYCTLRPRHRSLEIGWTWLTPSAWGTGANAEAKSLMLQHAFEVVGCQRVEFETDALNKRSRRALEALSATFEGVLRDRNLVGDRRRSSAVYSILDHEWPVVRESLAARIARHASRMG